MKKRKGRTKGRGSANGKWMRAAAIGLILLLVLTVLTYFVSRELNRREYKLAYRDEIVRCSDAYKLNPYLVAAVIHCESSNRPDVVSHAGAVGLMQIMPDTGRWIAQKLGIEDFDEEMLKDPDVNIEMGCWYLAYLLDRFEGEGQLVLAAYNAGPRNVEEWLMDERFSKDGILVEIPFEETANYVEKVFRTYETYRELYEGEMD